MPLKILSLLLFFSSLVSAEIKLPALIGDNMVLQSGMPVRIWGTANPGETVTVSLRDRTATAVAGKDNSWAVKLPPLEKGGPFDMMIRGKNTIVVHNILVGEVWVASGQSNMEWPLANCLDGSKEIAAANFPQIRLFTVEPRWSETPLTDVKGRWVACDPKTVPGFSGVAYFFGRKVHQQTKMPVGLILCARYATRMEPWSNWDTQVNEATLKGTVVNWKRNLAEDVAAKRQSSPDFLFNRPAGLFHGMILPLSKFTIRGVIWYQGESNTDNAYLYSLLFPAMIRDWRIAWNQGDFPFLYVQLAGIGPVQPELLKDRSAWAEVRDVQLRTLRSPNTAMVVSLDTCDGSLHPVNKQEIGNRLALAAEAIVRGSKTPYSGPLYQSMTVEKNKIRLHFTHTDSGLTFKTPEKFTGFMIADEKGKFIRAEAKIDGDTVFVWSDKISKPAAVRYAWSDYPQLTLFNNAGLPASPFQTGP